MPINIIISREINKVLNTKIPEFGYFIRLKCGVQFKRKENDWTKLILGILDTGAPISVIPYDLWYDLDRNVLGDYEMRGIIPKEECKVSVDVGKVRCLLTDKFGNTSKEIEIYAYLAPTNRVPLIIGFKNLLEEFRIIIECKKNEAILEEI